VEEKASMKRFPVIDISACTDCGSCLEICPAVFKRNVDTGYIEVAELREYPEYDIQSAMSICPADCIVWEELPIPRKDGD